MPKREELIQALSELDLATFEDVIGSAYRQRQEVAEHATATRPGPQATARQFAEWLAKRHMSSDLAIERVVYLPRNAPDNEIRLLEVNRLLNAPDPDLVEPLDFSPDDDLPFKVFVADITSDQWDRIKKDPDSMLPSSWQLPDNLIFTR